MLDGNRATPPANISMLSNVAPSYATGSRARYCDLSCHLQPLLSSRLRSEPALSVFGDTVTNERRLRTDHIAYGQPAPAPPLHPRRAAALGDGLFVRRELRDTPSIQGALLPGRRYATAVLQPPG